MPNNCRMKVKPLAQKNYPKECLNPVTHKNEMCVSTCVQMICETQLKFTWTQKRFYELQVKAAAISQAGYVNSYERAFLAASKARKWYHRPIKKEWFFTIDHKVIQKALETRPVILFLGGHAVLAVEFLPARNLYSVIDPLLDPEKNPVLLTKAVKRAGFFI